MDKIEQALRVALEAHGGQRRKVSGVPFVIHLTDVMKFLMYEKAPEHVVVAGILHDVLEDTVYPASAIEEQFGRHVLSLVESCTEPEHTGSKSIPELQESWRRRKEATVNACGHVPEEELLIKLADKLSNLSSLRDDLIMDGERIWTHFHAGKAEQEWYFRSLGSVFRTRLGHTRMWLLYEAALEDVFGKEK